ncbi:rCG41170 [Rattus norvegicus]|uniref:RCG41170 n=1 Tax=Rattus norvegicus TaxID=10116 RepID=A6KIJ8_RAT|nr:rCG41170 [Rattus norvegicus]
MKIGLASQMELWLEKLMAFKDSYRLSLRIAPHVLWGQTSRDSLFGSDVLRKETLGLHSYGVE